MIRLYYSFGICVLIAAIFIFYSGGIKYFKTLNLNESNQTSDIISTFKANGNSIKNKEVTKLHPLINQAQLFAGIINPPKPPRQTEISIPRPKPKPKPKPIEIVQKPKEEKVKFDLIATSRNELKPSESLALITESGKESYWIKQGDSLGNYVLKSVEHKSIVFENGNKIQKITVGSRVAVVTDSDDGSFNIKDIDSQSDNTIVAESGNPIKSPSKPVTKHKASTQIRKPLLRLGPQRKKTKLVALENK